MEIKEILEKEGTELKSALESMGENFLDRFKDNLKECSKETKDKVNERFKTAARLHYKAMTASSAEKRANYAEASEIARMRAVTILKAEAVVIHEKTASLIGEAFKASLELFSSTTKTVVSSLASGIVSGSLSKSAFKGLLKNLPNF